MPKRIINDIDEYADIIFDDNDNYKEVSNSMIDRSRWSISHEMILQDKTDGTFWATYYDTPASESNGDFEDYNFPPFELIQVNRVEKMIPTVVYEIIKDN